MVALWVCPCLDLPMLESSTIIYIWAGPCNIDVVVLEERVFFRHVKYTRVRS